MSFLLQLLPDNPVLTQELRSRMRGARAYWILFIFLSFLALVLVCSYSAWHSSVASSGSGASSGSTTSGYIYLFIVIAEAFLVLFITPALTSGALTIEREQRTMDMLEFTPLPRRSIVMGKLMSAVAFTGLLILSSLPLLSICFMLGSVDPLQVLTTYLVMLLGSFFVGAVGIMWSSIAKSTTQAVIFTYITLFLPLLVFLFSGATTAFRQFGGGGTSSLAGDVVVASVSPFLTNELFGIKVVELVGLNLLFLFGGLLLATIARVRLEMFPERKGWMVRALFALLTVCGLYQIDHWWLSNWYHLNTTNMAVLTSTARPTGLLIVGTLLLMLAIPLFSTGDMKPYEIRRFFGGLLWGLTPKGLSRGKAVSGPAFLLLLTGLVLVTYVASFVFLGKSGDINSDFGRIVTLRSGPAATTAPTPATPMAQVQKMGPANVQPPPPPDPLNVMATSRGYVTQIGGLPQIAIMLFSFVLGFSLFGLFLSVAFRHRWVALALAYVALIAIWVLPLTGGYQMVNGVEQPSSQLVFAYANPTMAIHQITDPSDFVRYDHFKIYQKETMWLDATLIWLAIGAISLLASVPFVRRERQRGADIPFEEMVASA